MEIKSKNIEIVDIDSLVFNPDNNNRHSIEQIEMLAKGIKHNGFRVPIIVSNRSGFIVSGHGRIEAAKKLGIKKLPVIFEDFKNEAEEYQFLTFDNEIARWSELDKQAVYDKIELLDLDIELLGIQDFKMIDLQDANDEEKQESDRKWMIEVQFPNEMEMRDIYDDLIYRGYIAKVKGE